MTNIIHYLKQSLINKCILFKINQLELYFYLRKVDIFLTRHNLILSKSITTSVGILIKTIIDKATSSKVALFLSSIIKSDQYKPSFIINRFYIYIKPKNKNSNYLIYSDTPILDLTFISCNNKNYGIRITI